MKRLLRITLVLALGLAWAQAAQPTTEPVFEVVGADACPFAVPEGLVIGENAECGFLVVPENRETGGEAQVRLPLFIAKSESGNTEDALVLFNGGPGQPVQDLLSAFFGSPIGGALIAERDAVFFEQRGTGYAEPALACDTEFAALLEDTAYREAALIEETRLETAALQTCGERLTAEGVDLAAYNTQENAADVAALTEALEYNQLNLLGFSYGSRLALQVMRYHPEVLRSVVLSSVAPPDAPIGAIPLYTEEVLTQLFADCAADEACAAAYPDLETAFTEVYATLSETPLELETPSGTQTLDATAFVSLIFELLYSARGESPVPAVIYSLREGSGDVVSSLLGNDSEDTEAGEDLQRQGMKASINCADERPFLNSYDTFNAAARPELLETLSIIADEQFVATCSNWNAAQLDAEHFTPVESEVPALVLSGSYDVATPASSGERAGETLPNATVATFAGLGHSPLNSAGECGFTLLLTFLSDPSAPVDTACAAEFAPAFVVLE